MFRELGKIVDYPLFNDSPKLTLSATLAVSSLQFSDAVRVLCASELMLGCNVAMRSQFEAFIRSVWVMYCANEYQVSRLSAELSQESQQACKNIPSVNQMMSDLEEVEHTKNLLVALNEFKSSSWLPLNSFVHSGIHAIHWTKNRVSPQFLDQIFRISNGLAILAFQHLGILTGKPGIQSELIAATACFSSCLPERR
ncbi:hypothetical protein [Aeromonas sp. R9-1]|uniref:DUF6988 family protein n=1 Tax=Aeromonas sp. R9-1 TaxID=3138478 RepID=UPI0034A5AE08